MPQFAIAKQSVQAHFITKVLLLFLGASENSYRILTNGFGIQQVAQ